MDIERLRRTLKRKWLNYYRANRTWLVQLGVWVSCDGHRRPSSSFILASLSVLEPRLTDLFPLIVDLSQDPDHVVEALGLNFDPEAELAQHLPDASANRAVQLLPSTAAPEALWTTLQSANGQPDEACQGIWSTPHPSQGRSQRPE